MINSNYVLVGRFEEEVKEGEFQTIKPEDISTYQGIVLEVPEAPAYVGNTPLEVGNVVVFAKYSPNTHMIQREGKELKFVLIADILEVLNK